MPNQLYPADAPQSSKGFKALMHYLGHVAPKRLGQIRDNGKAIRAMTSTGARRK